MKMRKQLMPIILGGIVLVAAVFALLPMDQAGTVHTTIMANTLRLSEDLHTATAADVDIRVTCPAESNGCYILELYLEENDGTTNVNNDIDLGEISINIDGDKITLSADLNIQVDEARVGIALASAIALGSGDRLDIVVDNNDSESASYNWRVIAYVEGNTDIDATEP